MAEGRGDFPNFDPFRGDQKRVNTIDEVSTLFLGQLRDWFSRNPPILGISNIQDFTRTTPDYGPRVEPTQSTISTTPANLATEGPGITGLANGSYVFAFGGSAFTADAASEARMALSVNSSIPTLDEAAGTHATALTSIFHTVEKKLNGGNNVVVCRYWSETGASASFGRRWLLVMPN